MINSNILTLFYCLAFILLLNSCSSLNTHITRQPPTDFNGERDLYIVDCLLPGKIKRLGNITYPTARRAAKTTSSDCHIRGGEYVEYDRADYRSALQVWLPAAKEGDKQAQVYVGEIFEKGVGGTPNYVTAANWYQKAAAQGNPRAQLNLAYLYEKGLGVQKNIAKALNFYRQASGLNLGQITLNAKSHKKIALTQDRLKSEISQANTQIRLMQKQLDSFNKENLKRDSEGDIRALRALYKKAEQDKLDLTQELESLTAVFRGPSETNSYVDRFLAKADIRKLKEINFGRYYALIIGNQDYLHLDDLLSPIRDAERLQQVLEKQYGFKTLLLKNAYEKTILNSINNFYSQIGKNDNLLVYYAGHGEMSNTGASQKQRGYWLPIDAHSNNISNWINNAVISDHLDRLKARSVMVIADSCYAGGLGTDKSALLFGISRPVWNEKALQSGLARKARVVISSGGEKPVLDGTQNYHSIFTSALINVLEKNSTPIRDSELFSHIAVDVKTRTAKFAQQQIPEMKPIREAGHEGGSFYFIPTKYD